MKIMRYFLVALIAILFSLPSQAQSLMGVYTSNYTTYEDELHPENNFTENNLFHIALDILDDNNGMVGVQDSRALDDIKFYTIESFLGTKVTDERRMVLYQAHTAHLPIPKDTKLIVFFKNDNSLNLMVNHPGTSQVYYDLSRIDGK